MVRSICLAVLVAILAGCETETRVIRDNSATTKFTNIIGGGTGDAGGETVSGAWGVSRGGTPVDASGKPPSETALRIAELLRKQRDNPQPLPQDNPPGIRVITSSDGPPNSDGSQGAPITPAPFGPAVPSGQAPGR